MDRIGQISIRTFEWHIPNFFSYDMMYCCSPQFQFGEATMFLETSPAPSGGQEEYASRWKALYFSQLDYKFRGRFSCTLSIKTKDGKLYVPTQRYKCNFELSCMCFLCDLDTFQLLEGKKKITTDNYLIIACTLICAHKSSGEISSEEETDEEGNGDNKALRGLYKVSQDFENLFLNQEDTDVTLKVKDEEFRAHKAILGTRSPVFRSMFKHDVVEKSTGVVEIQDCDPQAFQDFLLYLYSGRAEKISASNVLDLYTAADKYDIGDLKTECVEFMQEELSVDTFCDFAALALLHDESELLNTAIAFFSVNLKEIIVTVRWQSFMKENHVAANEFLIKAIE